MRLLQLTSDNPKFRTINFSSGLNIVVGSQLTDEQKNSINGIGKSMSLSLIHYMFGSKFKTKSEKKLEEYLSKYGIFKLTFTHKGEEYIIKKDFSQKEFYINGKKVLTSNYSAKLTELFFGKKTVVSFKQVFNCFARRYSHEISNYNNILTQQGRPLEDYYQQYTNLFLLGIDMAYVKKNFAIKDRLSKLKKATTTIKEYEKALDKTNLGDLKDEIIRLEEQIENFIIAENYDKLKKEADDLTFQINEFRDLIFFAEKKLKLKDLNFKSSKITNLDIQKVEQLFNEANFFFENKITKRLKETQDFHKNLIDNRKKRLTTEIRDLNIKIKKMQLDMDSMSKNRDQILKDLNNKGALEERDSLKDRIKTLEEEQKGLEKYEHILRDFKKDKTKLDVEEAILKQESLSYLEKNNQLLGTIERNFRDLVKRFYDNKGGSFKVEEAPSAKYLFNINSHIPKEGSQGVGEVKIFCYDVLLYLLNKDLLSFLAHDGCIFSEMDPRQKSTIFKVILGLIKDNEFQYFLNIGDSTLKEILDEDNEIKILTKSEREIIKNNIILELSDDKPENWLFGESFD